MSALRRIIGNMHVGASEEEVTEVVLEKIGPALANATGTAQVARRDQIIREALKIHKQNGAMYDSIYGRGSTELEAEITEQLYGGHDVREAMENGDTE